MKDAVSRVEEGEERGFEIDFPPRKRYTSVTIAQFMAIYDKSHPHA